MFTKFFGVTNRNKFLNELEKVLKEKFPNKKDVDEIINSIGQANGIASLDGSGKVPSEQLPSYVDDIVEVEDYAHLPEVGETGKIYVTLDTGNQYRWGGSEYVSLNENTIEGEGIKKIIKLSKAEYDTLVVKNINTIYLVDNSFSSFGGLAISPAPIKKVNGTPMLVDDNWDIRDYTLHFQDYGYTFVNIGKYFDSTGASFDGSHSIDNANKISYKGFSDWRLPTEEEMNIILTSDPNVRIGAIVNGNNNKHYSIIKLSDCKYPLAENSGMEVPYGGLLLYPDNKVININDIINYDTNDANITTTFVIENAIHQGCVYIPWSGYSDDLTNPLVNLTATLKNSWARCLVMKGFPNNLTGFEISGRHISIVSGIFRAVSSSATEPNIKLYLGSILIADSNLPNEIEQLLASI